MLREYEPMTAATVLLVDDDADLRRLLRAALAGNERFEVVGDAADGESALRLADRVHPDIVVLDLGLPDIAGREVLTRLRGRHPGVRVIVFTGTEPESVSSMQSLGAAGVVIKGAHLSRLLAVLEDVVDQPVEVAGLELERRPDSVGQARRFTQERLTDWGARAITENAVLVVSELVTNAITHGRSACKVVLRWGYGSLRIEVADFGPGSPEPQPQSTMRPSGRGLMIVSSVATAWGIDPCDVGKIVWAEIAA